MHRDRSRERETGGTDRAAERHGAQSGRVCRVTGAQSEMGGGERHGNK